MTDHELIDLLRFSDEPLKRVAADTIARLLHEKEEGLHVYTPKWSEIERKAAALDWLEAHRPKITTGRSLEGNPLVWVIFENMAITGTSYLEAIESAKAAQEGKRE